MNSAPTIPPAPDRPLRVLVVDDTAINRQIVQVFLRKLGHEPLLAEDGAQAVERFQAERPDLVLMDVMMPVMDGYEATRRIKALCGDQRDTWVPVVFLSALDKEENLVSGLDAGGDDYLAKPINFVILQAKLRSLGRAIEAHRKLAAANAELRAYREAQEVENALAADILSRQLTRHGLDDALIKYWISPAATVSGDVVAAARTPSGELCVMLADATGHGLAASISTLPLLTLFYEMVDWGMALPAIVARINSQLLQALPASRFVAAALVMVDERKQVAEAWVGGLPPLLLLGADGKVARRIESRTLPLGVVDIEGDRSGFEHFEWTPGAQLALYSDGLVEAASAAGREFGQAALEVALGSAPVAGRLEAVKGALQRHLGGAQPHDDVTLMLVAAAR